MRDYLINLHMTTFYGNINFNNTYHDAGTTPLCLEYIPYNDTAIPYIVYPDIVKVKDAIFDKIPTVPSYLIPKPNSDTDFLLSVILGTILPVIFIILIIIIILLLLRKTVDIIVLPKQDKSDWNL